MTVKELKDFLSFYGDDCIVKICMSESDQEYTNFYLTDESDEYDNYTVKLEVY